MSEMFENVNCEVNEKEYDEVSEILDTLDKSEVRDDITQKDVDEGLEVFEVKSTPKDRLRHEIENLSEKIDKLNGYLRRRNEDGIRMTVVDKLTDAQVYLLNTQLEVMHQYYNILVARYSIFDVKSDEVEVGAADIVKIVEE